MWGGTLEFKYEDTTLVATNQTRTEEIKNEFDFNDYCLATNTRKPPAAFQALVQHAIRFYVNRHEYKYEQQTLKLELNSRWLQSLFAKLPVNIANHLALFVDECYIPGFSVPLLSHQLESLYFVGSRPRSLLAVDTGLGKTATTLAHIATTAVRDALLIVPPGLKLNWNNEIRRFILKFQPVNEFTKTHLIIVDKKVDIPIYISRLNARKDNDNQSRFFIISYNLLSDLKPAILNCGFQWDLIVCDEAHALKNTTSQRTKVAYAIINAVQPKKVLFLTATPSCFARDWWGLLRFMHPTLFGKIFFPLSRSAEHGYLPSSEMFFFAERYTDPHPIFVSGGAKKWDFSRSVRMEELHALTRPFVLTQKKSILNLPPLIREYIVAGKATPQQQKEYYETMSRVLENGEDIDIKVSLNEQVAKTAMNKLPSVQQYVTDLLENNPNLRFSLWAHSKRMIHGLCEHLLKHKIEFICINGDTPKKDRDHLLQIMEHNTNVRVAVLSINTCGTGLNMTYLDHAVYAELTTHQIELVQSEGRHHRIGQKSACVTVQYLIYEHSTDEQIWKSILRKANVESVVLTNKKANFDYDIRASLEAAVKQYRATTKPKRKSVNTIRFGEKVKLVKKNHNDALKETIE